MKYARGDGTGFPGHTAAEVSRFFLPREGRPNRDGAQPSGACQIAGYGRLGGSVYTLKKELSISDILQIYPFQTRAP